MEKDFLHKVNLEALKKEVCKDLDEIGVLVQLKNPKGVYKWAKSKEENGTRPSYNAIVQLLQHGATVETLFGVEYTKTRQELPKDFREGMSIAETPMTRKEIVALFREMKAKGEI